MRCVFFYIVFVSISSKFMSYSALFHCWLVIEKYGLEIDALQTKKKNCLCFFNKWVIEILVAIWMIIGGQWLNHIPWIFWCLSFILMVEMLIPWLWDLLMKIVRNLIMISEWMNCILDHQGPWLIINLMSLSTTIIGIQLFIKHTNLSCSCIGNLVGVVLIRIIKIHQLFYAIGVCT